MPLNQLLNRKRPRRNFKKEIKTELLIQRLQKNSLNKDYLLALAQDLDNQERLMGTSWKEKNSNFTQGKSIKERNDLTQYLSTSYFIF